MGLVFGAGSRSNAPRDPAEPGFSRARFAAWTLPTLCALWLAGRFLPAPPADPALVASIEAVRVRPAPQTGTLEVVLPEPPGVPGAGLRGEPILAAHVDRLREEIRSANEELAHAAARAAALLETYPDDSAALRISGAPVPFFDRAADRLAQAREDADDRPGRALAELADVLRRRLAEPGDDYLFEEVVRRREVTRVAIEAEEALDRAAAAAAGAVARFRREAERSARRAAGPFQRRGPGRILEIVWAALIGAGMRRVARPDDGGAGSLGLAAGPTLAGAVLLAAEGTPLLPVDPLRGISLGFLPASLLLGWGGAALVARLLRGVPAAPPPGAPFRREEPENGDESRPDGPRPPRTERELPVDPGVAPNRRRALEGPTRKELPRRPGNGEEKLPFFRKRRRRP